MKQISDDAKIIGFFTLLFMLILMSNSLGFIENLDIHLKHFLIVLSSVGSFIFGLMVKYGY